MLARQSQTEGISVRLCDAGLRIRQANLCSVAVRARALLGFFAVIELFPAMTFGNRHVRFLFFAAGLLQERGIVCDSRQRNVSDSLRLLIFPGFQSVPSWSAVIAQRLART